MKVVRNFNPRTTVAGALLTSARIRTGLSQSELAERAGVAQSTVARIESGRVDPGVESLHRILASIGLEPRIHLEELDDHDLVLAAIDAQLTKEERVIEEKRHQRSVGKFKNAHPVESTS
jgi:transcriptional regulator with XRE-family HTH domain